MLITVLVIVGVCIVIGALAGIMSAITKVVKQMPIEDPKAAALSEYLNETNLHCEITTEFPMVHYNISDKSEDEPYTLVRYNSISKDMEFVYIEKGRKGAILRQMLEMEDIPNLLTIKDQMKRQCKLKAFW